MEDKEFKQDFLFEQSEIEKDWEKEWVGMPEYVQERKDIKTQSIWFPKLIFQDHFSKRYIDES